MRLIKTLLNSIKNHKPILATSSFKQNYSNNKEFYLDLNETNLKMFASKLNTMTGKVDWEILSEDYDYQQELARAGFADMLHDYERVI